MRVAFYTLVTSVAFVFFLSCSTSNAWDHEHKKNTLQDSIPVFDEAASQIARPGALGVYKVPALMVLAVTDSAAAPEVAAKVSASYKLLEEEIKTTGATLIGAYGQLIYNNDSANFKFTSMAPILREPAKQPAQCQLMTVSPGNMLVYNYYGSYQQLHLAYAEMKNYLKENSLEQVGALREFYITNPMFEPDSTRWLTRVMVPVSPLNKP